MSGYDWLIGSMTCMGSSWISTLDHVKLMNERRETRAPLHLIQAAPFFIFGQTFPTTFDVGVLKKSHFLLYISQSFSHQIWSFNK